MRNRDVIVAVHMFRARARRWLIRTLDRLVVWLGGPSAYYEGIPARRALDDVACALDDLEVPRSVPMPNGDEWPLLHHHRIRYLRLKEGVKPVPFLPESP